MSAARVFLRLILALTVGFAAVGAAPGTAYACSCLVPDWSEYADEATVIFVGQQIARVVHDEVADDGATLTFRVDRVYKGEAGPLIAVRTHAQGEPACGLDFDGQGDVGVAVFNRRGYLSIDYCSSDIPFHELEDLFEDSHPPDGSIALVASTNASDDRFAVLLPIAAGTLSLALLLGSVGVLRSKRQPPPG